MELVEFLECLCTKYSKGTVCTAQRRKAENVIEIVAPTTPVDIDDEGRNPVPGNLRSPHILQPADPIGKPKVMC